MARFMRSYGKSQRIGRPTRPLGIPFEVTTTTAVTLEAMPTVMLEAAFTSVNRDDSPEWVNITKKLQTLTWGISRSREREQFSAGTLEAVLRNEDGRFDTRNPNSPYYPNIKPMKQVRVRCRRLIPEVVSLDGTTGCFISTPSSTWIDDTDENDGFFAAVLIDRLEPYTADSFIMGKWGAGGNRSWRLMRAATGIRFDLSTDGTSTAGSVTWTLGSVGDLDPTIDPFWVSVSWDALTGATSIGAGPRHRGLSITHPSAATGTIVGPAFISTAALTVGADATGADPYRTLLWWVYYTQGAWLPSVIEGDDAAAISEAPGRAEINSRLGSWPDEFGGFNTFISKQNLDHVAAWSARTFSGDRGIHTAHIWTLQGTAKLRYENKEFHLFRGYADEWSQEPEMCKEEACQLRATDGFKVLSGLTLPSGWEAAVQDHIDGNVVGFNKHEAVHWYRLNETALQGLIKDSIGMYNGRTENQATEDFFIESLLPTDSDASMAFLRSANSSVTWDGTLESSLAPIHTLSWSICLWFKLTGDLPSVLGNSVFLYEQYRALSHQLGIGIRFTDNQLFAVYQDLDLVTSVSVLGNTINADQTYFVTVTWDSPTSTLSIYRDDTVAVNNTGLVGPNPETSPGRAKLGCNTTGGATGGFTGQIDEVVVFNRVLEQVEHRLLNAAGTAHSLNFPEPPGTSISKALGYATWPLTLANSATTFIDGLQPTVVPFRYDAPKGNSALDFIHGVVTTDRGVFYMNGRGEATDERGAYTYTPDRDGYWPMASISASQTRGLPYHSPRFDPSDADLVNEVNIENRWFFVEFGDPDTGTQYTEVLTMRDDASAEEYLVRSLDLQMKLNHDHLNGETLADLQNWLAQRALVELSGYAQPGLRATGVVLEPQVRPTRLFATVLNLAVMDTVEFIHVTPTGNVISDVYRIGGIRHNVDYTAQRWTTELQLDRIIGGAGGSGYWQLEVEGSSELGETTILA